MRAVFIDIASSVIVLFILGGILKGSTHMMGLNYTYFQLLGLLIALQALLVAAKQVL